MLIPFGVLSAAGGGVVGGTYDLIESVVLGSDTSSVTFSSLATYASTYKHLQIRVVARTDRDLDVDTALIQFNGDTGSNYGLHILEGNGSSVSSVFESASAGYAARITGNTATANSFAPGVVDLLDAFSSTKNTTLRSLTGYHNSFRPQMYLTSTLWRNTASLTSVRLFPNIGTNFLTGSRFSLYGIKG
jgi:hypothetical protein